MKSIGKWLAVSVGVFSCSAMSAVNIDLHRDIAPIVVNGEKLGFFINKKSVLALDDGLNQMVVSVGKLVQNQYGEREKFNSKPFIITFETSNADLELLLPTTFTKIEDAIKFDQSPSYILRNKKSGELVENVQAILPDSGGLTRDYEKEVAKYNHKNGFSIGYLAAKDEKGSVNNNSYAVENAKAESNSKSVEMIKYWYEKANSSDRKTFTDLALSNRNSEIKQENNQQSQSLEMMIYWFNETEKSGKKSIATWLINQE
ncbi:DUF2057 family protein [Vibrio sp. PNB22_2_2]